MNGAMNYEYSSYRLLSDALVARGYSVQTLQLERKYLVFTAPNGKRWLTRKGLIGYPFVSVAAYRICGNKQSSYAFAELQGIPIPKTLQIPGDEQQLEAFVEAYGPLVVKPLDSFSSYGLTMDVATNDDLQKAIITAQKIDTNILVQQQFSGTEIRFIVIEGEVTVAATRENCQVVGDGILTIERLIELDNDERRHMNHEIVPYPLLDSSILSDEILHSQTVPASGEVVILRRTSLVSKGGSYREITNQVHQTYKDAALRLATAISPRFAAVDMLVADYTQPATTDNYVFLEFSFSPSLRLFYDVRSGNDYDIVSRLADMIDDYCAT